MDLLNHRVLRELFDSIPSCREATMKYFALLTAFCISAELHAQSTPDIVLLDFTASYCQPCQQMVPLLQKMERDGFPIQKIDITKQPQTSRNHGVDRIPTLILMVEGKEVDRFVGLQSEAKLRRRMNDEARKLDMARRANASPGSETQPTQTVDASAGSSNSKAAESPGLLTRMKEGLFGRLGGTAKQDIDRPDFRAQSPEEAAALTSASGDSAAMQATVRVRLDDGEFRDVGTGTVIHSTAGQSTILTCAHIFKDVKDKAVVIVDVFRDGETLKYPATVLGGDHSSDVAVLQIQNKSPLASVNLASNPAPAESNVFSIGCNGGNLPTIINSRVIQLNRYEGPENIVCTIDPVQGRSGGGLFNSDGQLIGVCSGAFREKKEGLYTGVGAVRKLMTQLKLESLFESAAPEFADTLANVNNAVADVRNAVAEVSNPFDEADDVFADLFTEEATNLNGSGTANAADFATNAAMTAIQNGSASVDPSSLPDPFAPSAGANPIVTASAATPASTRSTSGGTSEITVIIGGRDSADRRVVVIPKPSPWLLELLTGDSSVKSGLAVDRSSELSTTSARRSAP